MLESSCGASCAFDCESFLVFILSNFSIFLSILSIINKVVRLGESCISPVCAHLVVIRRKGKEKEEYRRKKKGLLIQDLKDILLSSVSLFSRCSVVLCLFSLCSRSLIFSSSRPHLITRLLILPHSLTLFLSYCLPHILFLRYITKEIIYCLGQPASFLVDGNVVLTHSFHLITHSQTSNLKQHSHTHTQRDGPDRKSVV